MSSSAYCCCGLIPITTGTIIFSSIVIAGSLVNIGADIFEATQKDPSVFNRIPSMVSSVLDIVAAVLSILGATRRKPQLIFPAMWIQFITLLTFVLLAVIALIAVATEATKTAAIFLAIVLLYTALSSWFLMLMYGCYKYLKNAAFEPLLD